MYYINSWNVGINAFLIVFVSFLIASCSTSSKFSKDSITIEMEKTACYGACPVYTLQIDQNGNGRFNGVENTEYKGLFSFQVTDAELLQLKQAFDDAGFFELEDRYYKNVTDLPTTYLTYRTDGREKKIMDYYGAPPELKDLEKRIESLVFARKMKKIK